MIDSRHAHFHHPRDHHHDHINIRTDLSTFECQDISAPICLNGGICIDWNYVIKKHIDYQSCICQRDFWGPHCEYHVTDNH